MWESIVFAQLNICESMQWDRLFQAASPDQRKEMLAHKEKAVIAATEERRHQEICRAIRDSKPTPQYHSCPSPSNDGFLTGLIIGKLL